MLPRVLRSEHAVDPHCDDGSGNRGHCVEVGGLMEGIEERQQEKTRQPAADRAGHDLGHHEPAPSATAVPVCKVSLAVRAGRHFSGYIGRSGSR